MSPPLRGTSESALTHFDLLPVYVLGPGVLLVAAFLITWGLCLSAAAGDRQAAAARADVEDRRLRALESMGADADRVWPRDGEAA